MITNVRIERATYCESDEHDQCVAEAMPETWSCHITCMKLSEDAKGFEDLALEIPPSFTFMYLDMAR